jgi:hypothetical protein
LENGSRHKCLCAGIEIAQIHNLIMACMAAV